MNNLIDEIIEMGGHVDLVKPLLIGVEVESKFQLFMIDVGSKIVLQKRESITISGKVISAKNPFPMAIKNKPYGDLPIETLNSLIINGIDSRACKIRDIDLFYALTGKEAIEEKESGK